MFSLCPPQGEGRGGGGTTVPGSFTGPRSFPWGGVPWSHVFSGGRVPQSWPGEYLRMGYPLARSGRGPPPPGQVRMGYPHPQPGLDEIPPSLVRMGYPLPPLPDGLITLAYSRTRPSTGTRINTIGNNGVLVPV